MYFFGTCLCHVMSCHVWQCFIFRSARLLRKLFCKPVYDERRWNSCLLGIETPKAKAKPNRVYKQKQRHHNCTQTQVVDPNWLPTNIKISKRFLADNMLRRSKNTTAQPSIAKPHIRQLISPHPATAPFAQRATTTNHVLAWQHCLMAHKTPGTHVAYTFSDYGSCSKNKNDQPLAVNKSPLRNTRISIPTCQKQGCRFKTVQP